MKLRDKTNERRRIYYYGSLERRPTTYYCQNALSSPALLHNKNPGNKILESERRESAANGLFLCCFVVDPDLWVRDETAFSKLKCHELFLFVSYVARVESLGSMKNR